MSLATCQAADCNLRARGCVQRCFLPRSIFFSRDRKFLQDNFFDQDEYVIAYLTDLLIQEFDNNFHQFNELRFRVVIVKPIHGSQMADLQCNHNVSNVKNCELSESTKRNITQLCDLVTDNEPLRTALQKLIKD